MAITTEPLKLSNGLEQSRPHRAVSATEIKPLITTTSPTVQSKVQQHDTVNTRTKMEPIADRIIEQPLGTFDPVRVIILGAGASGLNMIRAMRKHLENYELVVYDKNSGVGGTWYENRYPGCKCDIPSHNYQFSWRPNPNWSAFFASSMEIEQYLKTLTAEEQLQTAIKLSHEVIRAEWSEDEGKWYLKVKDVLTGRIIEDWCNIFLNAAGILKYDTFPISVHRWLDQLKSHLAATGNGRILGACTISEDNSSTAPTGLESTISRERRSPSSAMVRLASRLSPPFNQTWPD